MPAFDVNNDAAIALTAKLEKLHRSAFPVAVRGTLNDAAFKTKSLIQKAAAGKFTIRQKNLFKKFVVVDKAKGFNLGDMSAKVGIDGHVSKGRRTAEGLATQETGGTVKSRKLLPMNQARISGSYGKKLRAKNRFNRINIAQAKNRKPGSKYVLIKKGRGGTVFDTSRKGKLTPVYHYRQTNKTQLSRRPFIRPSARLASKKMNKFYEAQAERQFKRLLK